MIEIETPVGRLVSGSLFIAETKDSKGKDLLTKSGEPRVKYDFGIAISKTDAGWPALYQKIATEARSGFPQLCDAQGNMPPTFAWKITDGDSQVPNKKGNKPCDKVGFPGHYVLWFSGGYAPKCADQNWREIIDPKAIKKGDYIRILGGVKANGDTENSGVYLNYTGIQLCGYGEAISGGIDLEKSFSAMPALPAGASATPLAPTAPAPATSPMAPAGLPGAPAANTTTPAANTTMPAPAFQQPPVNAAPTPGAMPAPGAIPAPGAVAAQPVHNFMEETKYTVPGQPAPMLETELRAAGYTDEHLAQLKKA